MKFGNEFWLILFREYISPKLFAVHRVADTKETKGTHFCTSFLAKARMMAHGKLCTAEANFAS
jgi:hypothetical protein